MVDDNGGTVRGFVKPEIEAGKMVSVDKSDEVKSVIMMNRAARQAYRSVLRRGGSKIEAQKAARNTLTRG